MAYRLKQENGFGLSTNTYSIIALQIVVIISGLLTGIITVLTIENIPIVLKITSIIIIVSTVVFMTSKRAFFYLSKFISVTMKKDIVVEPLKPLQLIKLLIMSVSFWILWGSGMYYFVLSLGIELPVNYSVIFIYPFSISVGIIAFISPGGIGVREGVLAGLLIYAGCNAVDSTEISVLGRLWFTVGEIIFFSISHIIYYIGTMKKVAGKI